MHFEKLLKENLLKDIPFKKKILITGCSGFIGDYILQALTASVFNNKNIIHGIDIIKPKNKYKNFKFFKRNLLKITPSSIPKIKYDYIIHLAGIPSPTYYKKFPLGTIFLNSNLAEILLKKSNIDKSKFIYFSSSEIYGNPSADKIPTDESYNGYVSSISDRSCYDESKRMGETLCVSYAHQYKIDVKIVRPFHTYGPKMDLKDGRVFADFVSNVVMNKNLIIKSDGKTERCYCYLKDAVIGFLRVLINGKSGNAYNIGNPNETYSVKELAKKILETQKQTSLRLIYQEQNDMNYLRSPYSKMIPNIDKVSKLGWKPTTTVIEGFDRTIKSYMDNDK